MNPSVATLIYGCGIAGLFFLNREKRMRTSPALWLPVAYLWIVGSRGPSIWLGLTPPVGTDVQLDGTPLDRLIFTSLLLFGVVVIACRGRKALTAVSANWAILIFFSYCLASVLWSDYPDVAAKRWVKAIGDLVMALIIVTDANPIAAFRRVVARVGFVLLPASVLLIKYYPELGRAYDPWFGTQFNTGVTTNKNTLGVVVLVTSLGALWCFLELLRSKDAPNRGRLLLSWGVLLLIGLYLLEQANSATSRGCFALGALLLVATHISFLRRRPGLINALVLVIIIGGGLAMVFGGTGDIAHAMGRKGDLTGRTEIWSTLIPMTPNPAVGAGFESFWLGERLYRVRRAFEGNPLNEAHDGYIEVYLNLGWIGVTLLALVLISGYRHALKAFRRNPTFGGLMLVYVVISITYSITEAGFRMLDPIWIFLLLAIVASSTLAAPVGIATAETADSRYAPAGHVPPRLNKRAASSDVALYTGRAIRAEAESAPPTIANRSGK